MIDIEKIHPKWRMALFVILMAGVIYGTYFLLFRPVIVQVASLPELIIPNGPNGEVFTNEQPTTTTTTNFEIARTAINNFFDSVKDKFSSQNLANTLVIDKIGVSASIESVGYDQKGNMATPSDTKVVAWYKEGVKIGSIGTAVISGHKDTSTGKQAVFYRLADLTRGDTIIAYDSDTRAYKYIVDSINVYPADNFPTKQVFSSDGITARLNLVTCAGKYNQSTGYTHRLVVSAILAK